MTLELGGKSANIVFDDADIDQAVKGVVSGIFAATGQTCIAGSRALIHRPIHDEFVERLLALAKTARMGNPLDAATQVGPVTTRPQYEKVLDYIRIAKEEGAVCRLGGAPAQRPECGSGWFVEPTIFTGVNPEMRIAQEEVFGPVLSMIPFDAEEEAIRIANGTVYGLAAGVWTHEHSPRADDVRAAGGGHGVGEHLPRGELHVAIRRIQAVRNRARERHRRDPRISADEERLDRHRGQRAESVRDEIVWRRHLQVPEEIIVQSVSSCENFDDETVAYILETHKYFEDLRQVAAQLAGLLVLAAAGGKSATPDHPDARSAGRLHESASAGIRSLRATPRACAHHDYLSRAAAALECALASAQTHLWRGGRNAEVEPIMLPLRAAYDQLRLAAAALPGFEIISFEHACCGPQARAPHFSTNEQDNARATK